MLSRKKFPLRFAPLLVFCLGMPAVQAAPPAVLTVVPGDASAVMVIDHLRDLSGKLSVAARNMHIPNPPDLLALLTQRSGVAAGLDLDGSAAVIFMPSQPGNPPVTVPPAAQLLLLVPATDPKSALASAVIGKARFTTPDAAGIAQLTSDDTPQPLGFAASNGAGKWIAFSSSKDTLTHYLSHSGALQAKLSPDALKSIDGCDAFIYANVPQFSAQAIQGVEVVRQLLNSPVGPLALGLSRQTMPGGRGAPQSASTAQSLESARRMLNVYLQGITQCLTDADSALVTFRFSDEAVSIGMMGAFKPESPTGKFFAAQQDVRPISLEGLPDGTLLAAGTFAWEPVSFGKLTDYIMDALVPEATAPPDVWKTYRQSLELQRQARALINGGAFAFYQPQDNSSGLLRGAALMQTTDSAKYLEIFTQLAKINFGGPNPLAPGLSLTASIQEHALTYKDVTLSKCVLSITAALADPGQAADPALQQSQRMLRTLLGDSGLTYYCGPLAKDRLIVVFGGDMKFVENALDAALSRSTALVRSVELADATRHILPGSSHTVYLPIARWIDLARTIMPARQGRPGAAAPGVHPPIAGPAAAPLVMSLSMKDSTASEEMYIPWSAIAAVVDSARAAVPGAPQLRASPNALP